MVIFTATLVKIALNLTLKCSKMSNLATILPQVRSTAMHTTLHTLHGYDTNVFPRRKQAMPRTIYLCAVFFAEQAIGISFVEESPHSAPEPSYLR